MACGYEMASNALGAQLPKLRHVWTGAASPAWPFDDMLAEIRAVGNITPEREQRLAALRTGNTVDFLGRSPSGLVRRLLPVWRKGRAYLRASS